MDNRLVIYGATGFTGRLIVREALALGLTPILGGRTLKTLRAVAESEGLAYRVAQVDDRTAIGALVRGAAVLLNAAGPFCKTAPPLARACIEHGVHYVDVSGEFSVIETLAALSDRARDRGVMLLPGAGFDVVPTDCMAAWLARRVPKAQKLAIGLTGLNAISRGSAETVFAQYDDLVMVRQGGHLRRVSPGALERDFDFGQGPRRATAITWADISSAYITTAIPNITVYYEATPIVRMGLNLNRYGKWFLQTPAWQWWQKAGVQALPDGPTPEQRALSRATVVVEASDDRETHRVRLHTPEVYSFTASTSVAIAYRVLNGDHRVGFQTPALAYGPEFVLSLPGVVRDLV